MEAAAETMTPVDALTAAMLLQRMCEPDGAEYIRRYIGTGLGDEARQSLERVQAHLTAQGWQS